MSDTLTYDQKRALKPERIAWRQTYRHRPNIKIRERVLRILRDNGDMPDQANQEFDIPSRFWSKTHLEGNCLKWDGNCNIRGYGLFRYQGKMQSAHRVAWMLSNERVIPNKLFVCHHCDNPPCVSPSHLFVGTQRDNVQDSISKGRFHKSFGLNNGSYTHPEKRRRGELNGNTKLTKEDVLRIRNIYIPRSRKYSARQLAREYGVHHDTVEKAIHGENWKWLNG